MPQLIDWPQGPPPHPGVQQTSQLGGSAYAPGKGTEVLSGLCPVGRFPGQPAGVLDPHPLYPPRPLLTQLGPHPGASGELAGLGRNLYCASLSPLPHPPQAGLRELAWLCVHAHVYTRVHTTGLGQGRELRSGPVHPPLGRWDLFGSPLMPSDSSLCHVGWGFREGVCFPGLCLMVNPTEVAPAGPLGSLATRPP